VDTKKIISVAI